MSDLVELLSSSGPVSLDELSLRSSDDPQDLAVKVNNLKRRGIVQVIGPHSETLTSLKPEEIEADSETIISLTRAAFKAITAR
jgi:hypothetical protein